MKKILIISLSLCTAMAFTSCKTGESAYKKAYEKAKAQELASQQTQQQAQPVKVEEPVKVEPVQPVRQQPVQPVDDSYRSEKVELVSGNGLKAYSVVCGSFSVKSNAEGLKQYLDSEGYHGKVVYNAARGMYRVVCASYDNRMDAARAKEDFKRKYPSRKDFQGSWLLYNN